MAAAIIVADKIQDSGFQQRYDPEIGCTVYIIEREFMVGGLSGSSYAMQLSALSASGVPQPYSSTHPTITDAYCTNVRVAGLAAVDKVKLIATYTQIPNQAYIPAEWTTNLESLQTSSYGNYIPSGVGSITPGSPLLIYWDKGFSTVSGFSELQTITGTATKLQAAGVLSFVQFVSGAGATDTVDGYLATFNGGVNIASWRSFPALSWMALINAKQIFPSAYRVTWSFVLRPPYLSGDSVGGWWDSLTFSSRLTDGQIPTNFKRDLNVNDSNAMTAAWIYDGVDFSALPTGIA